MSKQCFFSFIDLIKSTVCIHFYTNEIGKSVSVVTPVIVVCKVVGSILNLICLNIFKTSILDFYKLRI